MSTSPARYNLEYRGADAAASPYLQLGMCWSSPASTGSAAPAAAADLTSGDPGALSPQERAARGIGDLPRRLDEALDALEADAAAMGWLGPVLGEAYLMHKRGEVAMTTGIEIDELCRLYARAY